MHRRNISGREIMGTTLDGKTLIVTAWGEAADYLGSQWDAWVSSGYVRKVKIYKVLRTFTIRFVEKDVTWANSLANYFEGKIDGSQLTFVSDLAVRNVSTNVYVLNVNFNIANVGTQNIRSITVTLQET